jgi:hypothetical protein
MAMEAGAAEPFDGFRFARLLIGFGPRQGQPPSPGFTPFLRSIYKPMAFVRAERLFRYFFLSVKTKRAIPAMRPALPEQRGLNHPVFIRTP